MQVIIDFIEKDIKLNNQIALQDLVKGIMK